MRPITLCRTLSLACLLTASAHAQNLPPQARSVDNAGPQAMHLVCRGTGERKVHTFGSAFGFNSRGESATAFGSGQQLSQFGEQLDIDIASNTARARVPRRFLREFHGGEEGWFDVKDLVISDSSITGKVAINFTNHPDLHIDRRTGSVSLDGKVGAFAGQCEKLREDQRAF